MNPVPLYVDCDTGIDDALALGWLAASPEVEVVGVGTVSGNVSAAQGARNTIDVLALAGRSWPVAVGAAEPSAGGFTRAGFDGGATHVHGPAGLGAFSAPSSGDEPLAVDAAELLISLARRHGGELRILAVGPLTNLAEALRREPSLPSLIAEVTVMGGAALVPGNISPVTEANIGNDPEAAQAVLSAPWPVTLVPLDVTLAHPLDEAGRHRLLDSGRPLGRALGEMLDFYFDFNSTFYGERRSALHDPLAAAIATGTVRPTVAPRVHVEVDTTDGPGRGQTICDLRGRFLGHPDQPGAHVRVVLELGTDFAPVLLGRLLEV
ncbi:nucleoside hydrolase [Herbiconiux sp. VKM Ac-1786]|uniref:nucleoside hydrolase n=1 Tax=Herbiconiux sp. VKM Ac-1786 TaxID=2783824 RepID=UPI00188BC778|nr:nucleoside hydrolase [Herbiconiux sp. VKM Ac-1786]MBF4571725.1 nucleoside hydrolase [Herbiconiux sp. VKM Ac-1786]